MADALPLLIACGRAVVSPSAADVAVRAAAAGVSDWDAALATASRHGVLPLTCAVVLRAAGDMLAGPVREQLVQAQRAAAAHALGATRQLAELMRLLAAHGIEALPYKGPALALDAYGDAAFRECDDLDIVVDTSQLEVASAALIGAGYRPGGGRDWADARSAHGWQGHVAFTQEAGDALPVELHWRFCDQKLPWTLEPGSVLAGARSERIGGVPVRIPAPEDQLLLVLLHTARHGWDRLEPFLCAAVLCARGVDAKAFMRRAREAGGVKASLAGLALACEMFGVAFPPELEAWRDRERIAVDRLVAIARARLRAHDPGDQRDAALHLAALDGRMAQLRYIAGLALSPTPLDREVIALPRRLAVLYFPIRLARLAGRAAAALVGGR